MIIERGVEMPKTFGQVTKKSKRSKYAGFEDMAVGESVFIKAQCCKGGAMNAAYRIGKRTGRKFGCRKVKGGIRIWRIE